MYQRLLLQCSVLLRSNYMTVKRSIVQCSSVQFTTDNSRVQCSALPERKAVRCPLHLPPQAPDGASVGKVQ